MQRLPSHDAHRLMPSGKREISAGGVLYRCTADGPRYLLILDAYQNWGFPKGHVNRGETPEDAARREVAEETGMHDLILREPLGTIDWYFRLRGRLIHKYCHFFLFEAPVGTPRPQREEGITACGWYAVDDALATIAYANARDVLRRAAARASALCNGDATPDRPVG